VESLGRTDMLPHPPVATSTRVVVRHLRWLSHRFASEGLWMSDRVLTASFHWISVAPCKWIQAIGLCGMLPCIVICGPDPCLWGLIASNLACKVTSHLRVHTALVASIPSAPLATLCVTLGPQNDVFALLGDVGALRLFVWCCPE